MPEPKRLEFYTTIRVDTVAVYTEGRGWHDREHAEHRWRLTGANGEKGCAGEAYTRARDARLAAIDWLGVAQRSDLVVPDQRDRLRLARLLHRLHPEVSEQAWAEQLDPDSKDRAE